jgi:uncharacterized protein YceH (UPF0502 family)
MTMDMQLSEIEGRVLGALMEKEITTPEYYPLSLNALVNACNQKSNREPVMNLDDDAVVQAMRKLSDMELAGAANTTDSRVRKYEHRLQEVFNFTRPEAAILCVLLLRGAQTPGELRGRSERMYQFDELNDVQSALQKLMNHEPPLVKVLPRQPGTKESRYMHLLSGDASVPTPAVNRVSDEAGQAAAGSIGERRSGGSTEDAAGADRRRIAMLESEIARLRNEVAELRQQFGQFRKQFE